MEGRLYPGCSTDENPGAPITTGPAWQAVVPVRSGKEPTPRMGSHTEEGVPLPLLLAPEPCLRNCAWREQKILQLIDPQLFPEELASFCNKFVEKFKPRSSHGQ